MPITQNTDLIAQAPIHAIGLAIHTDIYRRMDIILGFCVRNHSGIDLHDTDIDFFRPIVFQKRTAPLTYYASMRLFFLLFVFNRSQGLT